MKSIKSCALVCMLFASVIGFSNPLTEKPDYVKEVTQMLSDASLESGKYTINFLVSSEGKIVIISTGSTANTEQIKSILNYRTINDKSLIVNKIYTLPITIKNRK